MLLKKITALESTTYQTSPPPPWRRRYGELVAPNAATSAPAAFESRFDGRFGAIDAWFTAVEKQTSIFTSAKPKLQEQMPAMIAQQSAHTSHLSRRPAGPYKDLSGHSLKTSRRTTEDEDDDSCSLSGQGPPPRLPVSAGSGAASLLSRLPLTDDGRLP